MNAELIKLPNIDIKTIKSTVKKPENFIFAPFFNFDFMDFVFGYNLSKEEIDILILIYHLYYTRKEKDNLLYFNTDDLLLFRGIKKNKTSKHCKTGYKKEVRNRIKKGILNLSKLKFFTLIDYNNFNFVLDMNEIYLASIIKMFKIKREIFTMNPLTKSWHKHIGLFLYYLGQKKKSDIFNIQIKKILDTFNKNALPPYKTRERFENVLDDLSFLGIIRNWHYITIDENALDTKNWLQIWKNLSIKIYL